MAATRPGRRPTPPRPEKGPVKPMPDKNPDASPISGAHQPTREELLRHHTPPGLKRWGVLLAGAALIVAIAGIALRLIDSRQTAAWTDAQAIPTVQLIKISADAKGGALN